ncbi:MAG: alpha/beta fold hydrolase [Clostridia bacterium]|nr:alpha/beta fold hydrolase [Clostridia bacterium]
MLVDLKPQELFQYNGISPRPDDFDEYWDSSLAEMKAVDPQTELVPCPWNFKNVDAYDMYYTGVGGARIHAKYVRPKNAVKAPVIFWFHGYSGKAAGWTQILGFVSQGYCVAALDCRGQGGCSEDVGGVTGNTLSGHIIRGLDSDNPRDLLFRSIFLDCAQLVHIVEKFEEADPDRLFAMGGSQGGALTFVCASLCPQIKAAAADYPFLSDYKRVWEMDMAERAYVELKDYFRRFDPRHEKEDETFYKLGYIDIQNLAPRMKAKMLMCTGLMDNVCPPSTQFAAYNKIKSEKKVIFYPDFGHEGLPDRDELALQWFDENS